MTSAVWGPGKTSDRMHTSNLESLTGTPVRFSTSYIMQNAAEILVYGTAVYVE